MNYQYSIDIYSSLFINLLGGHPSLPCHVFPRQFSYRRSSNCGNNVRRARAREIEAGQTESEAEEEKAQDEGGRVRRPNTEQLNNAPAAVEGPAVATAASGPTRAAQVRVLRYGLPCWRPYGNLRFSVMIEIDVYGQVFGYKKRVRRDIEGCWLMRCVFLIYLRPPFTFLWARKHGP
ncbi:hypothetical protein GWI33_013843 [Rhynchophorus ferrugineus]|uniref:Uncharacterized protein n=1 Tax=Rhynchophorus ferrugineus TaxID=354439 RepID=A0A834M9L0_RHYFE|nr:hypothetical protein GWI33_013843 [Rhynchophorus ferrugineus]